MQTNKNFDYKFDERVCNTCKGNCCIGESGYIWINHNEVLALAKYLNILVDDLIKKYLIKYNNRFCIKEKKLSQNNFACVFFDTNIKKCTIYQARPNQCKTFPFWGYFKNNIDKLKKECPAIF